MGLRALIHPTRAVGLWIYVTRMFGTAHLPFLPLPTSPDVPARQQAKHLSDRPLCDLFSTLSLLVT